MIVNDDRLERFTERFDIRMELVEPIPFGMIDIDVEEVPVFIQDDDGLFYIICMLKNINRLFYLYVPLFRTHTHTHTHTNTNKQ